MGWITSELGFDSPWGWSWLWGNPRPCPIGTGGYFPGIKWPGWEASCSPPSAVSLITEGGWQLPHSLPIIGMG
jgi:hypothetical protein